MISPQTSLDALTGSQKPVDEMAHAIIKQSLNMRELHSEGSSKPFSRDSSNSSKRLVSAEFDSLGLSPPVFADVNSNMEQQTNSNMEQSNSNIEQSNPNMEKTNYNMEKTNSNMEKTNYNMEKTNSNMEKTNYNMEKTNYCNGCLAKDPGAVAKCLDCSSFLCANCVMSHHFVPSYEGHHIVILGEVSSLCDSRNEIEDLEKLNQIIVEGKIKGAEISNNRNLEATSFRLSSRYRKALDEVNETYQFYVSMIQERKNEILQELEQSFSNKQVALSVYGRKARETSAKIHQVTDFGDGLLKHASAGEILLFKQPIESRLHQLLAYMPELNVEEFTELEFIANFQVIEAGVKNQFGYIKTKQEVASSRQQPPISRPVGKSSSRETQPLSSSSSTDLAGGPSSLRVKEKAPDVISPIMKMDENNTFNKTENENGPLGLRTLSKELLPLPNQFASTPVQPQATSLLGPLFNFSTDLTLLKDRAVNPYDAWANSSDNLFSGLAVGSNSQVPSSYGSSLVTPSLTHVSSFPNLGLLSNIPNNNLTKLTSQSLSNLSSDFSSPTDLTSLVYPTPAKSHMKREKMIYHCKFGEFGILEDQFTEPSGVAVNASNDIIVADTNNHKIKIFDKEGRFKFQFGEVGKRDGQLLYPNRVAVFKNTGDIVVTERSPTHQVQIYTKYGQFIRKFGATVLQHPRGVCVDNMGRVIVVECKVMRIVIFDNNGNLLKKFGCSQHLHFPNGVVVNDRQEIFISDNRAHCVKVFDYDGNYIRQIGGEGVTNYPIGVGINAKGEITVADNHNNFNLTVFTQEGFLVSALESKVKHAQCYDVALMDDGSVVLASKDFKLYIYKYVQVPPLSTALQM